LGFKTRLGSELSFRRNKGVFWTFWIFIGYFGFVLMGKNEKTSFFSIFEIFVQNHPTMVTQKIAKNTKKHVFLCHHSEEILNKNMKKVKKYFFDGKKINIPPRKAGFCPYFLPFLGIFFVKNFCSYAVFPTKGTATKTFFGGKKSLLTNRRKTIFSLFHRYNRCGLPRGNFFGQNIFFKSKEIFFWSFNFSNIIFSKIQKMEKKFIFRSYFWRKKSWS